MSNIEDPKKKQEMLDAVREICEQYRIMDEARDQVKEIISATHDALDIPKPLIRKVSRLYHKKTAGAFETETAEIKSIYTAITSR